MNRIKCIIIFVSLALFVISFLLYVYVLMTDPGWYPVSSSFHIHLTQTVGLSFTGELGGKIVIFNGNAPYTGSILAGGRIAEGWSRCGIYFRLIEDNPSEKGDWWTFMFSFWYPIVIFAIWPTFALVRRFRREKKAAPQLNDGSHPA